MPQVENTAVVTEERRVGVCQVGKGREYEDKLRTYNGQVLQKDGRRGRSRS